MVETAAEIAALGRARVAARRPGQVARHHPAILVEAADEVDRLGIAELRRLLEPAKRRRLVLGHALAQREQGRVIIHAPVEAPFGGDPVAFGRPRLVGCGAPAEIIAAPDHVDRHQMMLRGGADEPAERGGFVLRHAGAVEQDLAVDGLSFGQAGLGGGADEGGAFFRRAREAQRRSRRGKAQPNPPRTPSHCGEDLSVAIRTSRPASRIPSGPARSRHNARRRSG